MGAWGSGFFDNDAALDWVAVAKRGGTDAAVDGALRAATGADYLEVDDGSAAVAAAALVAAAVDGDVSAVPPKVRAVLDGLAPTAATCALAVDALAAVVGSSSELASLWGHEPAWRKAIEALVGRVRAASAR
jgi:hypothetical protein